MDTVSIEISVESSVNDTVMHLNNGQLLEKQRRNKGSTQTDIRRKPEI